MVWRRLVPLRSGLLDRRRHYRLTLSHGHPKVAGSRIGGAVAETLDGQFGEVDGANKTVRIGLENIDIRRSGSF
jgi:hypothetical protein